VRTYVKKAWRRRGYPHGARSCLAGADKIARGDLATAKDKGEPVCSGDGRRSQLILQKGAAIHKI
jgi:hypothetical protein